MTFLLYILDICVIFNPIFFSLLGVDEVIVSYKRQLSADIKMKIYNIQTSIASPERPKARANKTVIYFMIIIYYLRKVVYKTIHDFLYGSEPALIQQIWIGFEAKPWLVGSNN